MVIQFRYRDGTGKRLALSCRGWRLPVRANVRQPELAKAVTPGLHLFPDADSCAGLGRCEVLLKYYRWRFPLLRFRYRYRDGIDVEPKGPFVCIG